MDGGWRINYESIGYREFHTECYLFQTVYSSRISHTGGSVRLLGDSGLKAFCLCLLLPLEKCKFKEKKKNWESEKEVTLPIQSLIGGMAIVRLDSHAPPCPCFSLQDDPLSVGTIENSSLVVFFSFLLIKDFTMGKGSSKFKPLLRMTRQYESINTPGSTKSYLVVSVSEDFVCKKMFWADMHWCEKRPSSLPLFSLWMVPLWIHSSQKVVFSFQSHLALA